MRSRGHPPVRASIPLPDGMSINLDDGTLFGNDAGEDELPEVLASYFVDQPAFAPFFAVENGFRIARARKGMGKSAILAKLAYDLGHDRRNIIVRTTGADLMGVATTANYNHLALQNYWKTTLCTRINYELGRHVGFAFSDTQMALVSAAELNGFKERNLVGSLMARIRSSRIPIEIMSPAGGDPEQLLRRAAEASADKTVWVLVDDIDSTFLNTDEQVAFVSTFFSACRSLVREVRGLHIRASVRTDVWTTLRKNEDLDKAEQYSTDIIWEPDGLKTILGKKIYSYLSRRSPDFLNGSPPDYREHADSYIELVFERRLRWGDARVPPFIPIRILSANRPRWMAQLCRLSGQTASRNGSSRIGTQQINTVMKRNFTRSRLDDLYKEHAHQFADLERLVETVLAGGVKFTTQDLLRDLQNRYVRHVGHNSVPMIDGYEYRQPMQLAHFLYKIGFISGRRNHDFTTFEQRPELLKDVRNADDGMAWEIYPSYRVLQGRGTGKQPANSVRSRPHKWSANRSRTRSS